VVIRKTNGPLAWQSKVILLLVVPWTVASVLLQAHWWWTQVPVVAYQTLGISAIFGLLVWRLKAGTLAAAATGVAITASLMFSTARYPYQTSWLHGGLLPLLAVFLFTFAATKIGKAKKEKLGTGESKRGRNAAQVVANLGVAALGSQLGFLGDSNSNSFALAIGVAVLAEAAADTVSSEIGQVFGGQPRLLTTLRKIESGVDGGVTLIGTTSGILAAVIVALIGSWAIFGEWAFNHIYSWKMSAAMTAAATFGLLFDSLLGATIERRGWLNNDAVNFLSTFSSGVFMLIELIVFKALAIL
jgi:uncharacterized protein (TIGR00297 family)